MDAVQFCGIAALLLAVSTAVVVVPLFWRARDAPAESIRNRLRSGWPALAVAALMPLVALAIYASIGSPFATMHARANVGDGRAGGDLDQAIARLRARLDADPGDAAGWRLLAKSYEYLGREDEAAAATAQAEAAEKLAPVAGLAPALAAPAPQAARLDSGASALAQRAQQHRRRREFHAANQAFSELARRGAMSADLWADYADSLGGERGALDAQAATFIDNALRLDPQHAKALWLLGSWQTQQAHYAAALTTWQRLATVLPADSPDMRFISANIDEARGKLAASGKSVSPDKAAAPVALRGIVELDPRWHGRLAGGAVLFVFARAADERGPPLAVLRAAPGPWPLKFVLDDSNAMLPQRKLSDFTRVVLEARISASGNALAQPGDLRAVSAVLDPRAATEQRLTISEQVGAAAGKGG